MPPLLRLAGLAGIGPPTEAGIKLHYLAGASGSCVGGCVFNGLCRARAEAQRGFGASRTRGCGVYRIFVRRSRSFSTKKLRGEKHISGPKGQIILLGLCKD
jgi:hypothetical protein